MLLTLFQLNLFVSLPPIANGYWSYAVLVQNQTESLELVQNVLTAEALAQNQFIVFDVLQNTVEDSDLQQNRATEIIFVPE